MKRLLLSLLLLLTLVAPVLAVDVASYQDFILGIDGRPLAGAQVTVKDQAGDPITLYDETGTSDTGNPTYTNSVGYFLFWSPPGTYDVVISKSGSQTLTLENVEVGLLSDGLTSSDVSVNPVSGKVPAWDGLTRLGYADLQAIPTGALTDGWTVNLAYRTTLGDGGGGPVHWNSSDLSTEVAADEVNTGEGDGGRYIAPASDKTGASGAWVYASKKPISVLRYGAKGDAGVTDNTVPFTKAFTNKEVFIPDGDYWISSSWIPVANPVHAFGQSRAGTIITGDFLFGSRGMFFFESTSADTADNIDGVHFENLTLYGKVDVDGWSAFTHLFGLYGVSNFLLENATLKGNRGDCMYLGGKNIAGTEFRHNEDVTVRNCVLDGLVQDNRNGISVIDCDGLDIEDNVFQNIGNATLSRSVGAIDFEPNDTDSIYKNIKIVRNKFLNIDTANTAGITLFNTLQSSGNIGNILIAGNYFEKNYRGITQSTLSKTPNSESDNIKILDNTFLNSTLEDINVGGWKDYQITGNTFSLFPLKSTSYRGGILVGGTSSKNAINGKIIDNNFIGLRPQFGCVALYGARKLDITGNTFQDISGRTISPINITTAGAGRYLSGLNITKNRAYSYDEDQTAASLNLGFWSEQGTVAHDFVSWSNIMKDNTVEGNIALLRGGSLAVFNGQPLSAAPTTGSWSVHGLGQSHSMVLDSAPTAGAFAFATNVSGTFGTLSGVTGNVTNGSKIVTNIVDSSSQLREGHFITLVDSATVFRITKIDGTTLYLSANFDGTTGVGVAIAWPDPTFVII